MIAPGTHVTRRWDPTNGPAYDYEAFVPARLQDRIPNRWSSELVRSIDRVSTLLRELPAESSMAGLAVHLGRAEAGGSSMIEGHFVQARCLFEMQLEPDQSTDAKALPVYRNWEMLNLARAAELLTSDSLLEWHRLLMEHDPRANPGEYRSTQNWIGGDGGGPRRAVYVPPPPELVEELVDDLIAYANDGVEHPAIKAAVIHAQFESIHPFVDGNGRVGRALIHWVLRDLEPSVPPLALVWYAHGDRYYRMLDTWRSDPDPEPFVAYLLESLEAACQSAAYLLSRLQSLREHWVETAGGRAGSLKRRMLDVLATTPIIDARLAAERLDADSSRFSRVAREIAESGVLNETKVSRRRPGRPRTVYEAREVFEIINGFVEEFRAGGIPGVE